MATQFDSGELDLQEQLARIRKMIDESDKLRLEQRLMPKDYTLRVVALVATIVGISASALTAVLLHP